MKENDTPLISIVMPVYNGEFFLDQSITSIMRQTYPNWELICVDDSSTDNSFAILSDFQNQDERIKVYRKNNEKIGNISTKYGIQKCSGSFFIYMSQDDTISENLLEENIQVYNVTHADAIVPIMMHYPIKKGKIWPPKEIRELGEICGTEAFLLSIDWRVHGFVMWSMDVLKQVHWDTAYLNSDEFTNRMLYYKCSKVAFSSGIFYYHVNNPNAITQKWNLKLLDYLIVIDELKLFCEQEGFQVNEYMPLITKMTRKEYWRLMSRYSKTRLLNKSIKKDINAIKDFYVKYMNNFGNINLSMKDYLIKSNINHLERLVFLIQMVYLIKKNWHRIIRPINRRHSNI